MMDVECGIGLGRSPVGNPPNPLCKGETARNGRLELEEGLDGDGGCGGKSFQRHLENLGNALRRVN